MATKEEQDALLKKTDPLTAEETQILKDDADALKLKHDIDVKKLAALRKKNLDQSERDEVQALRQKIGPEIKRAANMDRKIGRAVESVY